jgi:hypothetical protein
VPQETDTATGNFVLQESPREDPQAPLLHRNALSVADGTSKPSAGAGVWLPNPGFRKKARVFVTTTGSPTTCTLRPYLRSGGSGGQVGSAVLQTLNGSPNFDQSFDVIADGDDVAIFVETLSGGTSPTVTIWVSWR